MADRGEYGSSASSRRGGWALELYVMFSPNSREFSIPIRDRAIGLNVRRTF